MTAQRRKDSKGRVLRKGEYERGNGTYMYVFKAANGKKRTVYAPTLKELRVKENEATRDILDGINPDGARATIDDMYVRWKQTREMDIEAGLLRYSTYRNYCYMYEQFVQGGFGSTKLKDVTAGQVETFYKYLVTQRGLKVHSVDSVHVPLKQVMQLAVESNCIRRNPTEGMMRKLKAAYRKKEKGIPTQDRALTPEQQDVFLKYLESSENNRRWLPLFTVLIFTGMRIGELTGLRWCDVHESEGYIEVNHTLVYYNHGGTKGMKCKYAINDTKTPAGFRSIPMLPIVKDAFIAERERQAAEGIKSCVKVDGYEDFVFVNRFGQCLNQATVNKAIRRIVRDCNFEQLDKGSDVLLPAFSCHWLRHTFATRLIEADVNVKAAQKLLGHADVRTTMNIYAAAQEEFVSKELFKLTNSDTNDLQKTCADSREGCVNAA